MLGAVFFPQNFTPCVERWKGKAAHLPFLNQSRGLVAVLRENRGAVEQRCELRFQAVKIALRNGSSRHAKKGVHGGCRSSTLCLGRPLAI
jgi:hypothetical protein